MKTFLLRNKKKLLLFLFIYLLIIFWLGYRVPWFDKHPTWSEFPEHTNDSITIQLIENFEARYSNKYKIPPIRLEADKFTFVEYKTNLINIKSVGFRVTKNDLILGSAFHPSFGGSAIGNLEGPPISTTGFDNLGYEYIDLYIGKKHTHFKFKDVVCDQTRLLYFYQYNFPKNENDTLFFNYGGNSYEAFIKHHNE